MRRVRSGWPGFAFSLQPQVVEFEQGFSFPAGEPLPVQLAPGQQARFVQRLRAKATTAAAVQLQEELPHIGAGRWQWRHVQIRRAPAGAALGRFQVIAQGFSIGLLLVEFEDGLRVVFQRLAQALIKRSWSFMAASSWRTTHWRLGSL